MSEAAETGPPTKPADLAIKYGLPEGVLPQIVRLDPLTPEQLAAIREKFGLMGLVGRKPRVDTYDSYEVTKAGRRLRAPSSDDQLID